MDHSFFSYVKTAFLQRWNLLVLGAATAAGIISGYPEVALPAVAAAEVAFLAALATNRRFQKYVDARHHKARAADVSAKARERMAKILDGLSRQDRRIFDELKTQCEELGKIAQGVKAPGEQVAGVGGYRSEGMNRLLWIYLKLLFSKGAVERFFETIDKEQIEAEIARAQERLASLGPIDDDSPNDARRRTSLEDQLKTSEARLSNYENAADNYEFIMDEIARLSSKIAGLAEMAVNRQDTSFITSEVDSVSASVASSEKAMSELDFLTGWSAADDVTPELLGTDTAELAD